MIKHRPAPPVDRKKSLAAWESFFTSCRHRTKPTPLRESTYNPEPSATVPVPASTTDRAAARRAAALKAVQTRRRNAA